MYEVIVLSALAIIWMTFAVIQDIRIREVANWLNFSLIVFALGFRFFYCLFSSDAKGDSFAFFYQGLIWLGIFAILGNLFYYSRIFAGGDAKLMIALGVILPFSNSFIKNFEIVSLFFILFLIVGSAYGIAWSIWLAIKNSKKFKKEFYRIFRKYKNIILFVLAFGIIIMVFGFVDVLFLFFGFCLILILFFYIFAKAVENVCMIYEIPVKNLREGDWLYENIKLSKGKLIKKDWEGLTNKEIKLIQKKFKKIKIKQGIPFVPVFFISFLILVYLWNNGFNWSWIF